MSSKGKKIFLALSIIVPMIIYCYVYYRPIIANAPFRKADFVSLKMNWGVANPLENTYNSTTGDYRFVDKNDSLRVSKVYLDKTAMNALHKKADSLGVWNFPDTIGNKSAKSMRVPHYEMHFTYKEKSKNVIIYADFDGNPRLINTAMEMKNIILKTIDSVQNAQIKK